MHAHMYMHMEMHTSTPMRMCEKPFKYVTQRGTVISLTANLLLVLIGMQTTCVAQANAKNEGSQSSCTLPIMTRKAQRCKDKMIHPKQ